MDYKMDGILGGGGFDFQGDWLLLLRIVFWLGSICTQEQAAGLVFLFLTVLFALCFSIPIFFFLISC